MSCFPAELFEIIIGNVARLAHPTATLKACCLVSRLFHHLSRPHLLSGVTFTIDKSFPERAKRLLALYDHDGEGETDGNVHNPRLRRGIRSVTIRSPPAHDPLRARTRGRLSLRLKPEYAAKLVEIKEKVSRRLRPAKNSLDKNDLSSRVFELMYRSPLEAFTLTDVEEGEAFHYIQIKPMLAMASLCSLHLFKLRNFPPTALASAIYSLPRLEQLTLIDVQVGLFWAQELDHTERFMERQSVIEELRLGMSTTNMYDRLFDALLVFDALSSGLPRFPRLKKLSIQTLALNTTSVCSWLNEGTNEQIESLTFEDFQPYPISMSISHPHVPNIYDPFMLDELPALRKLEFHLNPKNLGPDLSTRLIQVAQFLQNTKKLSSIEAISIQITLRGPSVKPFIKKMKARGPLESKPRVPLSFISSTGWRKLDEVLTEPFWVRLRKVDVQVLISSDANDVLWSKVARKRRAYCYPRMDKQPLMPLLTHDQFIMLSMMMEMEFYK